ncbi:MAG: DUF2490 domain-containing protein [Tannerella sp.]|nr:DUF2490 domain-containing protein [Tannerella sp.]
MNAGDGKQQDAGLWLYASVSPKPVAGKWLTTYGVEYRSKENFRETSLWSAVVNVDYIFNPYLRAGAGYEFFLNRQADGKYTPEHRYYPEAILSYTRGAFSTSLRSRIMNTFTQWSDPCWEGRHKLKASHAIPHVRLKPFIAVEPYHDVYPVKQGFTKIRYFAGFTYSVSHQKIDIYYLREDYLHNPFVRNVIQIEYNYAF